MEISALIKSLTAPTLTKALDSLGALQKGQIVEVTIAQAASEGQSDSYRVEIAGKALIARGNGSWRPQVGERYVMEVTQTGKQPVLQRVVPAQVADSTATIPSSASAVTATAPGRGHQTLTLLLSTLPATSSASSAPPPDLSSLPSATPPAALSIPSPISIPVKLASDHLGPLTSSWEETVTGVVIAVEGSRITLRLDATATPNVSLSAPPRPNPASAVEPISRESFEPPVSSPISASIVEQSATRLRLRMDASTLLRAIAAQDASFPALTSRQIPDTPLQIQATLVAVRDDTLQLRWDSSALASRLKSDPAATPVQTWPLVEMDAQQNGDTLIITRLHVLKPEVTIAPSASPVPARLNQTSDAASGGKPDRMPIDKATIPASPPPTAAPSVSVIASKLPPETVFRPPTPTHLQLTTLTTPPSQLIVETPVTLRIDALHGAAATGVLQFTPQEKLDPSQHIQETLLRCLPQQIPLHELLPQLQRIAAVTPENRVAETLHWLARTILECLPPPQQLTRNEGLQQAWQHSGTFLESQLTQKATNLSWQVSQDFKAQLVKLVHALRDATSLPMGVNENSVQIDELRQKAEGVLAKITLNQLASLPNDTPKQVWQVDLPVWDKQAGVPVPRLEIEKESHPSSSPTTTDAWSVTLTLTPPQLGTLRCKVRLLQQQISVYFFSERPQIAELIQTHLETLQQQLQEKGLQPSVLAAYQGQVVEEAGQGKIPFPGLFSDRA